MLVGASLSCSRRVKPFNVLECNNKVPAAGFVGLEDCPGRVMNPAPAAPVIARLETLTLLDTVNPVRVPTEVMLGCAAVVTVPEVPALTA